MFWMTNFDKTFLDESLTNGDKINSLYSLLIDSAAVHISVIIFVILDGQVGFMSIF